MQIQWLPHEKKLFRMSLSFVAWSVGPTAKEHRGLGGWEGGEELAPTLPCPLPSAPPQRPLEGLRN